MDLKAKENILNFIKILVYGINNDFSRNIDSLINISNVTIEGYIVDNPVFGGTFYNGVPVYTTKTANFINFDYLIISEKYDYTNSFIVNAKNTNKVLDIFTFINVFYNYELYKVLYNFQKYYKSINGIITGISYAEVGIDTKYLNGNFVNLAVSSQDIFYDYNLLNYVLSFDEPRNNIKYCIIGLSYYSFQYDLSMSRFKGKTLTYYPTFRTTHNYQDPIFVREYDDFKSKANLILANNFFMRLHEILRTDIEIWWDNYTNAIMNDNMKSVGKDIAFQDCNKHYPKTVEENISIFRNYLNLLKKYNIKPTIVVLPASKCYTDYYSNIIETEFKLIISQFIKEYDLQYIDYFRSEDFNDVDFYDVSHLNKKGAEKFTKIINNSIRW
jgi:hypothetical protein